MYNKPILHNSYLSSASKLYITVIITIKVSTLLLKKKIGECRTYEKYVPFISEIAYKRILIFVLLKYRIPIKIEMLSNINENVSIVI